MKDLNYSIKKIRELSKLPLRMLLDFILEPEYEKEIEAHDRLNYAFAACCGACLRGIGLVPYDEQIDAAWALFRGKVIEMKTGEGKTISAVFAAFLHFTEGRKTHIMTYNDYLVERDYKWMKPIYELLRVNTAYIVEQTPKDERKSAYRADVVYNTAKEAGFDFLRDFVVYKPEEVLHENLDVAIVDEADSILIDEARIPLVIAGSVSTKIDAELENAFTFVKSLTEKDYGISDESDNAYLTDKGIAKAEEFFKVSLYDEENQSLLSDINDCLNANFTMSEDTDYIFKDNEILIIDEFTGRVARNRRYPGALQSAVELKHGIKAAFRGVVMGTVPLQYFIRQYEHISGMTGTVYPSDEEFELLYDLKPEKIPPHTPSQRIDHPIEIYFNRRIKLEAIKKDIIRANKKGQPILVGAESIEESELLTNLLRESGIEATVLNAKNDEAEAEIIKNAGVPGAVTISTNMAGRGVDILLGGFDQSRREEAVKSGGLYVICTSMRESSRINRQLRGRTGRQGDVGESKAFVALDDDIMKKYELNKLVSGSRLSRYTEEAITDKVIVREVQRIQRISEGDRLEERKRLLKFSMISEKHRDAIFKARKKFVTGENKPNFWQDSPEDYVNAIRKFGEECINDLQNELILDVINEAWSDYLEYTSSLREGIHLTSVGGKSPVAEFNITSQQYYERMEERVVEDMERHLKNILTLEKIEEYVIFKPESIYTYLQNESADELVKKPILLQAVEGARLLDEEDGQEETGGEDDKEKNDKYQKKGFFKRFFS
ncbi:MAG: preprotein translocase subunit SecA [Oscillospiraceae bacterium]|nr:preprotein translocase subunit SecA [Oscillospiraceae bacterium]